MKPSFEYAVIYQVGGHTAAPLRSGDSENDVQRILRTAEGVPFVQGASVAGAMKEWLTDWDGDLAEELFGSREQESSTAVSDCVFEKNCKQEMRPRVRIDPHTGAADPGGKFDVAYLDKGAKFFFTLTWKGIARPENERIALEQCLAAMNTGAILLGGQKSIGFGRVALDEVKYRVYEMRNEQDRNDWLDGIFNGTKISPDRVKKTDTVFRVTLTTDRLLLKAAVGEGVGEDGINAVPMRNSQGEYIVPGSALKGVFRTHIGRIVPFRALTGADVNEMFGCMKTETQSAMPGRVFFSDAVFTQPEKMSTVTRVRINKFTGGVIRGGLFREKPIGGTLAFEIRVPDRMETACGLLLYALRDMGMNLFALGSEEAIGSGRVESLRAEIETADGQKAVLCSKDGALKIEQGADWIRRCTAVQGGKAE